MKALTGNQIKIIKEAFEKEAGLKAKVVQGHISSLMDLSYLIGEGPNYSVVQKNLKSVI